VLFRALDAEYVDLIAIGTDILAALAAEGLQGECFQCCASGAESEFDKTGAEVFMNGVPEAFRPNLAV
jgi:hypothetical protein